MERKRREWRRQGQARPTLRLNYLTFIDTRVGVNCRRAAPIGFILLGFWGMKMCEGEVKDKVIELSR